MKEVSDAALVVGDAKGEGGVLSVVEGSQLFMTAHASFLLLFWGPAS